MRSSTQQLFQRITYVDGTDMNLKKKKKNETRVHGNVLNQFRGWTRQNVKWHKREISRPGVYPLATSERTQFGAVSRKRGIFKF